MSVRCLRHQQRISPPIRRRTEMFQVISSTRGIVILCNYARQAAFDDMYNRSNIRMQNYGYAKRNATDGRTRRENGGPSAVKRSANLDSCNSCHRDVKSCACLRLLSAEAQLLTRRTIDVIKKRCAKTISAAPDAIHARF